jgi:phosphoadenosine phosphosulfate reductase
MKSDMELKELSSRLNGLSITDSIRELVTRFPGKVVFTTSFGIEDQVITNFIFKNDLPVEVVTLDTGRLFPETYQVFAETITKYRKKIDVYFPEHEAVEKMVSEKGPFSFYESKDNRLECCRLRKVVPLRRALKGRSLWITGIRAEQSDNRADMSDLEWDDDKKLIKFHPLYNWSMEDVENYIKENDVPYNSLHNKGYVSIGCEPCTRAISKGQDFRSGRWWWEIDGPKECGCHIK